MHFPLSSMGQTGATLRTTAGEHLAAIGGTHTLAEPVLLGALALLGLVGTEHAIHLFLKMKNCCGGEPPLLDGGWGKDSSILRS